MPGALKLTLPLVIIFEEDNNASQVTLPPVLIASKPISKVGSHRRLKRDCNFNTNYSVKLGRRQLARRNNYEVSFLCISKNLEKVLKLQNQLFILRRLYSCGQYSSTFIKGVKCALNIKGICSDCMAEPFNAFLLPERKKVAQLLDEFETQYSL